jgi:hypothetical protein
MFDTPGKILIFSSIAILVLGIILIDYLSRKRKNKYLIRILIVFFSSIPINLLTQYIYFKSVFIKKYKVNERLNELGVDYLWNSLDTFDNYFLSLFYENFSLEKYYIEVFNPRWIFIGVNSILLVIILYYLVSKVYWFKKNLKFILLFIVLKPILTFFLYPADTRKLIRFNPEQKNYTQDRNFFAFHIEYIFNYELIAFLYSLVLVYLLYLFLPKKEK